MRWYFIYFNKCATCLLLPIGYPWNKRIPTSSAVFLPYIPCLVVWGVAKHLGLRGVKKIYAIVWWVLHLNGVSQFYGNISWLTRRFGQFGEVQPASAGKLWQVCTRAVELENGKRKEKQEFLPIHGFMFPNMDCTQSQLQHQRLIPWRWGCKPWRLARLL